MKTQRQIVTELIDMQVDCLKRIEKYESVDISISIFGNYELLDVALDIIGFPSDNSSEFDYSILNGQKPDGRRTDFDNLFCRDYLYDNSIIGEFTPDSPAFEDIETYVDWLYNEFKKLSAGNAQKMDLKKFEMISLN